MQFIKNSLITIVLVFLFISLVKNIVDYQDKLRFFNGFKTKYEEEKKRNISLKTDVIKNSDPNQVEKTIRDKLNLSRENEQVVILPEPSPTPEPAITPTYPVWRQWLNIFLQP